jgi:hypothetical protein
MRLGLSPSRRVLIAAIVVLMVLVALAAVVAFDHQVLHFIATAGNYVGGS